MPPERKHLTADEIVMQMIELAEKKYNCSQILMILALRQAGASWWFIFSLSGHSAVLILLLTIILIMNRSYGDM